jgi:hypothetical protein
MSMYKSESPGGLGLLPLCVAPRLLLLLGLAPRLRQLLSPRRACADHRCARAAGTAAAAASAAAAALVLIGADAMLQAGSKAVVVVVVQGISVRARGRGDDNGAWTAGSRAR